MPRMIAPDKGVKQTDIGGRRYNPDKGGLYNVNNKDHVAAMKREGFVEASLLGATTNHDLGYTCANCGFGSWFKTCSRCGSENDK